MEKNLLKCNFYAYFPIDCIQKLLISGEKNANFSRIQEAYHVVYIFLDSDYVI